MVEYALLAGFIAVAAGATIAANGHGGFYGGPVAKRIVEALAGDGGLMELSDLAEFAAEETEPAHVNYKGYDVYGVPPQSQGPVMLQPRSPAASPPFGFGMSTRLTGHGVQRPASRFARIFSPWRCP